MNVHSTLLWVRLEAVPGRDSCVLRRRLADLRRRRFGGRPHRGRPCRAPGQQRRPRRHYRSGAEPQLVATVPDERSVELYNSPESVRMVNTDAFWDMPALRQQ